MRKRTFIYILHLKEDATLDAVMKKLCRFGAAACTARYQDRACVILKTVEISNSPLPQAALPELAELDALIETLWVLTAWVENADSYSIYGVYERDKGFRGALVWAEDGKEAELTSLIFGNWNLKQYYPHQEPKMIQ